MGWLNTALNAASLGADLYNASQLSTLRRQGADAALIQAFIRHLRDQIFQFKQAADNALAMETRSPLAAAGAISVVADRLHDSGVTPELFPELGDKEYAAQTIRLIEENHRRLIARLTPAEQGQVARVVAAADRLPDYNYYLENYDDGRRLVEATPAVAQYAGRNGCLAQLGVVAYVIIGLPAIVALFSAVLNGGNWSGSGATVGFVLGACAGLVGMVMILRWMHSREYKQAKKVVDELKDQIDLPRFIALDNELGSTTRARQIQQETQSFLAAFFGEPSIQAATTTTVGSRQFDPPAAPVDRAPAGSPAPQVEYAVPEAPPSQIDVTRSGTPPIVDQPTPCSSCGQPVRPGSRFCPSCGQALAASAPQTASPARTLRASVVKRLGAVQSNTEVTRGPADSSGNAPWLVGKKGQQAAAEPFLNIQCPWCDQRYSVNAQPAHLELFCLACGKGMWVDVE